MISINRPIYQLLSGVTENIYPLILPENTEYPAIVYSRQSNYDQNKDTSLSSTIISINVLSEDYAETIDVSEDINDILDGYNGAIGGYRIRSSKLSSIDEIYQEGVYVQKIIYQIHAI